jgi:hypothetical protein
VIGVIDLSGRGVLFGLGGSVYDWNDPFGWLFLQTVAMVAEFEADLENLRTRGGMAVAAASFTVTSTTVADGAAWSPEQLSSGVPGGKDVSPQLSWSGAPDGTKSYAVTVYDPDAPTGSGFWQVGSDERVHGIRDPFAQILRVGGAPEHHRTGDGQRLGPRRPCQDAVEDEPDGLVVDARSREPLRGLPDSHQHTSDQLQR